MGVGNLLARRRQSAILAEIRTIGSVRVAELSARYRVSEMTIRRDLAALARQGLVEKVHGGALLSGSGTGAGRAVEPGFEAKSSWAPAAKEEIARAAAALAVPGSAVALSAGTTTRALARHLAGVPRLTVVTNSVRVAEALEEEAGRRPEGDGATVVLTGGVRTPSDALVGPIAELALHELHVDLLFTGCHGIDPSAGLTTPNLAEAETNRALVGCAGRVVAVADHSKWGVVSLSSFVSLSGVDTLVTDADLAEPARRAARDHVRRLIVADADPARGG
ncbi:DeoR/GlpR family DNA-binding transcription regulator [Phaeacidiphilus oryzae]|uniref:DeoR/GlpR family DNA-binding transcription regulator n=1 Tax=Phaeacidiphilus oryzae TaxID=348818 RepID=UPI0005674477|nr:DeoR/GlpR family DNA-binding transcription regulator [Phaeacidiphilus oryzae]